MPEHKNSTDEPLRPPDSDWPGYPPPPQPVPTMLQTGSAITGALALVAGALGYDQAFLWLAGLSVALNAISIVARGGWAADSDWPGYPPPPRPLPMLQLQVWALLIGLAGVVAGWLGHGDVLLILTVVSVAANLLSLFFGTGRRPPQAAGAQRNG